MPDRLLIKKYSNRRLYDTEKSTYITLNQLSEIIREGCQVLVVDAKTQEDVTAFILTQIIMEEARKNNSLLPVTLLHLLIQCGQNVMSEFFEKHLELTIRNYLAYKAAFDKQFRNWLEMGKDLFPHTPKPPSSFASLDSFFDPFSNLGKEAKKDTSSRE